MKDRNRIIINMSQSEQLRGSIKSHKKCLDKNPAILQIENSVTKEMQQRGSISKSNKD